MSEDERTKRIDAFSELLNSPFWAHDNAVASAPEEFKIGEIFAVKVESAPHGWGWSFSDLGKMTTGHRFPSKKSAKEELKRRIEAESKR